ncbi:hypothetical protein FGI21_11310 [Dickeya zeae]|uniref:Uncharacterized protein n=1 Tax=Dickeya zeae TaxID=204042 RepID=A0ABX8VYR3_9GAMM|nr:hypothetical protein FGI21_11310 [Dickeya zeae]
MLMFLLILLPVTLQNVFPYLFLMVIAKGRPFTARKKEWIEQRHAALMDLTCLTEKTVRN